MNNKVYEPYMVKKSTIHGDGLYANKDYKKGELILSADISRLPRINNWDNLSKEEEYHVDYVGRGKYVVAHLPYAYINHSCEPNVYVKHETIARSKYFAMRNIIKGEEFTYDFGVNAMDQIDIELSHEDCHCGSKNCRKILSTCFIKQPIENQRKYYKNLPPAIKRKYKDKIKLT